MIRRYRTLLSDASLLLLNPISSISPLSNVPRVLGVPENTWLCRNIRFIHSDETTIETSKNIKYLNKQRKKPLKTSDTFGTLELEHYENSSGLEDDDGEAAFLAKIADTGRPRPFDYLNQIEMLVKPPNVDLRRAIEILEVDMKNEFVKPIPEIYRVLIHTCGVKGYSDKAFDLYRQYTARRFPNNFGIYADLFNACANCPKDGKEGNVIQSRALQHAKKLYEKIFSNTNGNLPSPVYHTMIKAFGRCGEIESAFDLLDKMGEKKVRVSAETICHVLQACISDKEAGFRHALLLWRKMRRYKIKPNVHGYNLLLRTAKECGVGDSLVLHDILIEAMSPKDVKRLKTEFKLNSRTNDNIEGVKEGPMRVLSTPFDNNQNKNLPTLHSNAKMNLPNFLANKPIFDIGIPIVGLSNQSLTTAENKFLLCGGLTGFLEVMAVADEVQPNIKTFSQLLHCIPSDDETRLVKYIKEYSIKTDIDFFNQLIRKRVDRKDYKMARLVLEDIKNFDLAPDIATFGCLAMTCRNDVSSKRLLKDMHTSGIRPNIQIITALLSNACYRCSFEHIEMLLSLLTANGVVPNIKTIQILERFYFTCRELIVSLEKYGVDGTDHLRSMKRHVTILHEDIESGNPGWKRYIEVYRAWLEKSQIEYPTHPWKQFLTFKDLEDVKSGSESKQKYLNDIINIPT